MAERTLIPGIWGRSGHAIPLEGCRGGGCSQGRTPSRCDCSDTEMDCEIAPDADRVICAPLLTEEDRAAISRIRRMAMVLAVAAFSGLAALLGIADPRFIP